MNVALKEWAVSIRALREGRQILLLRKGGLRDAGGEFALESREALLFPTYIHEDEQTDALQPCYGAWRADEDKRRPAGEVVRIDTAARITDTIEVKAVEPLIALMSQHIYSESLLRFRFESDPTRPLWALFVRTCALPEPYLLTLQPEHYGCRSWITLTGDVDTSRAEPVLTDRTYDERVRVTRAYLEGERRHG